MNPTGRFVVGGPKGDAGLTGRKIIADTYGRDGASRRRGVLGQGSTKVDRSAAYAARYVAGAAYGVAVRALQRSSKTGIA